MSAAFKAISCLVCLSFLPGLAGCQDSIPDIPAAQQNNAGIEKAILKVHSAMRKAAEKLDADKLYSYVLDTNKGSIIENGNLFLTRRESLDSTKQGLQEFKKISYSYNQKHITVISPTVALWVGEGTSTVTIKDGRKFSGTFAESIVFVKKDSKWKVLHAHRSAPIQ